MTTEQDQEWQRYIDAWYTMYLRQKQVMHEMMQEMAEGASHDPR